jgi:hypothetical protein
MPVSFVSIRIFIVAGIFFAGMFLCMELGYRLGRRGNAHGAQNDRNAASFGIIESAIFALFSLLLAFTFSATAQRFDERRHLIIEEANSIRTAWRTVSLLPASYGPEMQDLFGQYVDARLRFYKIPTSKLSNESGQEQALERKIWVEAVAGCADLNDRSVRSLILTSFNDMFNMAAVRRWVIRVHTPFSILAMLVLVGWACSLLAGLRMSGADKRSWVHVLGFASIVTLAVLVILDMEYPRFGLIGVDTMDAVLHEVRGALH